MSTSQGRPAKDASLGVTYRTISGRPEDVRGRFSGRKFAEWEISQIFDPRSPFYTPFSKAMTSLKQLMHAFEQTPLPPYRTYFMDAPIHINFKETYGERISYLPIFLLEF